MSAPMDCRGSTRLLSEERDGALPDEARARLEAHLAGCPACTRCRSQFAALGLIRLLASGAVKSPG